MNNVKRNIQNDKLLGNRVENILKTLGGDKVAALVEKVGRKPCGCAGRRDALNRWHLRMLAAIDEMRDNEQNNKP